jgi:transposase InsO family protein
MREEGLACKRKTTFKTTTDSDHNNVVAPDSLTPDFSPATPDKSYVSDMTYIWTSEGWRYLAVVIVIQNGDTHRHRCAADGYRQ